MSSSLRASLKHWYEPSAVPIYGVVGIALAGVAFYLTRLATDPNNAWSNKNPYAWNDIKPTDTPRKFLLINKEKYEKLKESASV